MVGFLFFSVPASYAQKEQKKPVINGTQKKAVQKSKPKAKKSGSSVKPVADEDLYVKEENGKFGFIDKKGNEYTQK